MRAARHPRRRGQATFPRGASRHHTSRRRPVVVNSNKNNDKDKYEDDCQSGVAAGCYMRRTKAERPRVPETILRLKSMCEHAERSSCEGRAMPPLPGDTCFACGDGGVEHLALCPVCLMWSHTACATRVAKLPGFEPPHQPPRLRKADLPSCFGRAALCALCDTLFA